MKKALFNLHIAIFLAGFTAILGRLIQLNEALLVWYRLLLSVGLLFILLKITGQFVIPQRKSLFQLTAVGFLIACHWVLFYGSIKYGNISIALVCLSSMAFFTAVLEPVVLKKKFDMLEVVLGIISIVGIYIIFDFHPQYKVAIIFGILSSVFSSLFGIFNKQLIEKTNHRILLIYELAGGLTCLTLMLPIYLHYFPSPYLLPTATDWLWLLVLASLCTVLAFELQLQALKKISAFTISLSYNLEPVYGIIMAFVFFGENKEIKPQFYLGAALITATILIHTIHVYYNRRKIDPYDKILIE